MHTVFIASMYPRSHATVVSDVGSLRYSLEVVEHGVHSSLTGTNNSIEMRSGPFAGQSSGVYVGGQHALSRSWSES